MIFSTFSKKFVIFGSFIIILLSSFFLYKSTSLKKSGEIIVESGSGYFSIAKKLKNEGFIESTIPLVATYRILSIFKNLDPKSGEYFLEKGQNIYSVIEKINSREVLYRKISFIEGNEIREIVNIINNDKNLLGPKLNLKDLEEGNFMPDTYFFTYPTTKLDIVKVSSQSMKEFLEKKWEIKSNNAVNNKLDIIILASIIQKEAANVKEMGLISSVFENRLIKGIRLGSDPTTRYEITKGQYKLKRALAFNDLKIKGDYNTYAKFGLPRRPICSPGREAILAALNPEKTNYIYFVADPNGTGHIFNEKFEDHIESAKSYREMRKAYYKSQKNVKE